MTPISFVSPRVEGDGRRQPPGADPAGEGTPRFADLLTSASTEPRSATAIDMPAAAADRSMPVDLCRDLARSDAAAQVFNQYGFFGRPIDVTDVGRSDAVGIAATVAKGAVRSERTASVIPPTAADQDLRGPVVAVRTTTVSSGMTGVGRATTRGGAISAAAAVAVPGAPRLRADPSTPRTGRPVTALPPPRKPPVAAAASTAVAVNAAAHGIEVAAQVAGLDDRDRARLSDEIAELLSSHGYTPSHIAVTGPAPRGARQERH